MGSRVLIKPIQTGDRILDQWNRESLLQQGDIYNRIEAIEATIPPAAALTASAAAFDTTSPLFEVVTARLMLLDQLTDLWWPLNDAPGTVTARNIGNFKATGDSLVGGATCISSLGGFVASRCRRLYGANATRGAAGAVGMTGSSPSSVSITCWARLGQKGGGNGNRNAILFGYMNTAGTPAISVAIDQAGLPFGIVQTTAGARTLQGFSDMHVDDGVWHHYCVSYNGTTLRLVVDGIEAAQTFAQADIVWAIGLTPSWHLGLTGDPHSMHGLIQDCRMHSTVRDTDWCDQAWRRGTFLFRRR
jgi:hypothetical protein